MWVWGEHTCMRVHMCELHVETALGVASQEYCLIFETWSLIYLGLPFKLDRWTQTPEICLLLPLSVGTANTYRDAWILRMGWVLNAGPYAHRARDLPTELWRCSFFCVRMKAVMLGEPPPVVWELLPV